MLNWFFKDKFGVEKALLAGRHRTYSQRPSVLHFSFNKAATQTVKKLLIESNTGKYATQESLQYINTNVYKI